MLTKLTLHPDLGILALTGKDATVFLHNQVSNDINNLPDHHACYATYNTPQGRVISNFIVFKQSTTLYLVMPKDLIEKVSKRLHMFVLRNDVQINNISSQHGIYVQLPTNIKDSDTLTDHQYFFSAQEQNGQITINLPHGGKILIASQNDYDINQSGNVEEFKKFEISSGYPTITLPTSETCVAQMLNQEKLGAVHFKKGCYPGQEIIARAQYRGKVKRGMAYYTSTAIIEAGEKLLNTNNEDVGLVINTALVDDIYHILAVIKHSAANQTLHNENNILLNPQEIFFDLES